MKRKSNVLAYKNEGRECISDCGQRHLFWYMVPCSHPWDHDPCDDFLLRLFYCQEGPHRLQQINRNLLRCSDHRWSKKAEKSLG